ncbi:MAG: hypothetical protein Q8936_09580, partial [Bacillota bacterium]|nr:hypothetical protein [Bacillota bacterium]
MKKRLLSSFLLLLLLLTLQQAFPSLNASAATNNMLPPSNLSFQLTTPSSVKLSWSSVYGATGYNVYGIIDGQLKLLGTTTSTYLTFNNLAEGSYSYVVSTLSTDGESGPCAPVTVNIVYPDMVAPTNFISKLQNVNDVVLSWTASQYAQSYNIYQITADGQKTLVTSVSTNTYTITNVSEGTYTYAVSAVNSLYGESSLSNTTQVQVVFPTMTAPGNLTYSLSNGNDITLKWNAVNYASGYKIYQIVDGQKVLKSTITGTSISYTNMAAGDYVYEIHSYSDRFGESQAGSQLSFTLTLPTMQAPSNLTYSFANVNDMSLKWNAVSYATSYKIYQIVDGQKILKSTVTGTSVTYTNMPAGDYVYEVHSYSDRFGESLDGSLATFTLVLPTMQAPGNLVYTFANGNDITLSWASTPYATSYKIYQIVNGQKVLKSTLTGTTATYTNMPGGDYTFEIHSYSDRFGESTDGSSVSFSLVLPVMQAPGNLAYTITNGNDITLNWGTTPYATSYKVYQIVNGQKVLKSTLTGTTVTYTNMSAGDYTYEIHSYSSRFGESTDGSSISFSLVLPVMQPPTNVVQTIKNVTDFTLNWDSSPYATSYKIYQIINGQKVLKSTVTGTSVSYTNMVSGEYDFEIHSYSTRFGESVDGSSIIVTLNGQTMQAPTGLTYSIANGNDITLKWTAAPYATSYKIYQVIDGQPVLKQTVTSTSVTFTNMPGGNYDFIIDSVSTLLGESPVGAETTFPLVLPTMPGPTNLAYKLQNINDVVLTWSAVTYASSYKIYELVNGQLVLKTTVTSTTATLTNVSEGDHTYVVDSVSTRFGESPIGSQISLSIVFPTMLAPANFTYSITNGNDITLNWNSVSYATSYNVYQIIDGQKILKQTVTGTSVTFTNMPEGDYNYEVDSYSSRFGESQTGSQVSFSLVLPTMLAPTNFIYSLANGNDITLKWTASQYATNYRIYQIVDGQKILKQTIATTSVTFTNMPAGDYNYEVDSYSSRFGESSVGSQLSFTLTFPTMLAPDNFTYTITNGNDITLKWNSVSYATSYNVYQIINGQKVLKQTVTGTSVTFTNMPEGDYNYEVDSYSSRFGESQIGSQVSFSLVFPTILSPANLTYSIANGNDITLKWTAAQYAANYRIYQIVDGQKILKQTVTTTSVTFTNMPAGDYNYEVDTYSSRFGESPVGSQLNFTLVFPIMQSPSNLTNSIANGNDITLKWNTSTYATSYKIYQIVDGQKVLRQTVTTTSVTFTNMPAGDYSYEVDSYSSRFGESPIGSTINFTLTWPVVQPPTLTATVFNVNNITFSWQSVSWANEYRIYELINGVQQLIYKGTALTYKVYNLSEATHTYVITAYNTRFGESAPSAQLSQTIIYPVMQSPVASVRVLDQTSAQISWSFATYANGYNVYEIINNTPVLLVKNLNALSYTVTNLSYANHQYYVTSYSNSFGESDPSNTVIVKLIVDTDPPVTSANAPTNWVNQNPIIVTLSAFDKDTGVANTYYSINDGAFITGTSFTINQEGITKISFYSVDKAGNKESVQTIYVKIDKTAPVTTSNAPADWSKDNVTINLTAADNLSGVANTYYSIDGSDYLQGTSFTIQSEGVHKVSFYSVDAAGNVEAVNSVYVKIDKTAPVTTSNAPADWSKDDVTINLTSADNLSGVTNTYYSIDGSDYLQGTSFIIQSEGVHKVSFY